MTENEVKNKLEVLKEWVGDASLTRKDMQSVIDEAIQALEEIQQYRAIGTVEEFKELKEKSVAKKPFQPFGTHSYKCSNCWQFVAHEVDDNCDLETTMADYCPYCGQKLDWQ